jgi:hypothetical protein
LDWHRYQPSNFTVSNGTESLGGQRCSYIAPWQHDPLLKEQGGWAADACLSTRSFICQAFGETYRFSLVVSNSSRFSGGYFVGGNLITAGTGHTRIVEFTLLRSAALYFQSQRSSQISTLNLFDGSKVFASAKIKLVGSVFIGEGNSTSGYMFDTKQNVSSNLYLAQPKVIVTSDGSITASCSSSGNCGSVVDMNINSAVEIAGPVTIGSSVTMNFMQVSIASP